MSFYVDTKGVAQQGSVIRADVHLGHDGRPKGSGIVAFESPEDARNAIAQFNGYDWQGRTLEVREDRFAGAGGPGFGAPRGGFGGGYGASRGGFSARGGVSGRAGYGGGYGGRGNFAGGAFGNAQPTSYEPAPPNPFTDFATSGGERSETIYVRNVSSPTVRDILSYLPFADVTSCPGQQAMMTSSSSSPPSERSSAQRFSTSPTDDRGALVSWNLMPPRTPRLQSVCPSSRRCGRC